MTAAPTYADSSATSRRGLETATVGVLIALSASHMLNDVMQSLAPALYPVFHDRFALSFFQIGLITFVFQLTASFLQPVIGLSLDKRPLNFILPVGMAFTLVGLPETEVKEARDRVRAAIQNARYEFPARRITVNLAPADLPKESGRFDLPIALAILAASGQVPADRFKHAEFAGELALTGELRPVRGALAMALATRTAGRQLVLPSA